MNISDIQNEIIRLKKEKDICILAHSYQAKEILEIADYTGDSYKLSVDASRVSNQNIIMSGVRFMAETCKLLSPEKRVFLPNSDAGCSMADQMDRELISQVKKQYPDHTVVAYINTTADLKTICDVCVTSSSAVDICRKIPNNKLLFIPDCNLGAYVAAQIPEKEFKLLSGGCPIHACNYAVNSDQKEFIIGTEISIQEHLQYQCPDKRFYYLTQKLICPNMKSTTLIDVYNCAAGLGGEEIQIDDETITKARKCIDEMIRLGEA